MEGSGTPGATSNEGGIGWERTRARHWLLASCLKGPVGGWSVLQNLPKAVAVGFQGQLKLGQLGEREVNVGETEGTKPLLMYS